MSPVRLVALKALRRRIPSVAVLDAPLAHPALSLHRCNTSKERPKVRIIFLILGGLMLSLILRLPLLRGFVTPRTPDR